MLASGGSLQHCKQPRGGSPQSLSRGPLRCRASAVGSLPWPTGRGMKSSNPTTDPRPLRGADKAHLQHPADAASAEVAPPEQTQAVPSSAALKVSTDGAALMSWVCEQGGYVHPSLQVVESTPATGCRGVVATSAIQLQELNEAPLVAVPERLYMTSMHAKKLLDSLPQAHTPPRWPLPFQRKQVQQLSGGLQLAILLAYERAKGQDSFWYPYINALPSQPPAAWLMSPEEVTTQLQALGEQATEWRREVFQARNSMQHQAQQATNLYGKALKGVTEENVLWALAQVVSRAFGGGEDVALAPLIDMCNHKLHAATPAYWVDDDEGEPIVFITSLDQGQPRALEPGEELFISYLSNCTPLAAWLNFGFVPQELRPGPAGQAHMAHYN